MSSRDLAADAVKRWWLSKWDEQQRRRWYTVAIFAITTSLLFADQNLLAPNLSEAAKTFGFTDLQRDQYLGGVVSAAFFIVGAPAALLVGYWMDRHDRVRLLVACVVLGEAPCLATVFVTRFWQLLLTRLLTGVAVGGAAPIIYGLLSDLFPPEERAYVTTCVVLSQGAGTAIGQAVASIPGLDWRMPFVVVSAPTLALVAIMALTTHDPPRGGAEPALRESIAEGCFEYTELLSWAKFRTLCKVRTNLLVIFQGLPGCLPWGVIIAFLNDYLQGKGLERPVATLLVLTFGSGGLLGAVVAGVVGQRLYNWRKGALPIFTGVAVWLGMPVLFALVNSDGLLALPMALLLAVLFLGGAVASIASVVIRPLIMNVNMPESRGIALAFQATLDDLGKGLGPALVAGLISLVGRVPAFNIAIAGWVPCGLLLFLAGWTISGDEWHTQRRLADVAAAHAPAHEHFLNTNAAGALVTPAVSLTTDEARTPTAVFYAALELGSLARGGSGERGSSRELRQGQGESAPLLGTTPEDAASDDR